MENCKNNLKNLYLLFIFNFSFDSRDPGVYTASTVTGLLEHYKDPAFVMFFEPMLTQPLNRNFCFSLQQLCRATIATHTTYDGVDKLCLPKSLKTYLKEYHYKQKVRSRENFYSNIQLVIQGCLNDNEKRSLKKTIRQKFKRIFGHKNPIQIIMRYNLYTF